MWLISFPSGISNFGYRCSICMKLVFLNLSCGYMGNFSLAIAVQFSEIIALPLCRKDCNMATQCAGWFAAGQIARIFRILVSLQFSRSSALPWQCMLHTEILICNSNTSNGSAISENYCIVVTGTNFCVYVFRWQCNSFWKLQKNKNCLNILAISYWQILPGPM